MSAASVSSLSEEEFENFGSKCRACSATLEQPWICCVQCRPYQHICARCFSFGVEFDQHESDHPYMVMRYSFPLYEASWTAAEEIRLLESIQEYGIGNWSAVSGRMRVKGADDCERHYFKYYVENPQPPLPEFDDPEIFDKGAPVVFKLSDNPPRPPEGSTLSVEMAGYSAARGDFNVEFDNFIELDLCHMTFTDEEEEAVDDDDEDDGGDMLYRELKLSALDVYRNCLMERQRRKKIVREYGLINVRKWYGMLKRRYEHSISLDFMRPFMHLFPPVTFDKYMESLHYEKQLKSEILRLQEFRRNGLTRLRLVKTYYQMKQRRDHIKSQRHLFTDVLNHVKDEQSYFSWLAKQAMVDGSSKNSLASIPFQSRKAIPRLKIDGLPGYEKLSEAEREMCSEVRLVPQAYLEFARILTSECAKQGSLRLAQARSLIKIDVNKTRKLYDFLIKEGNISKDPL
uniref:Transcriptional adapter n=1 Tax=Arion vulgaris TaxID=1028688 RepID=A0A0B7A9D5_9EUPU